MLRAIVVHRRLRRSPVSLRTRVSTAALFGALLFPAAAALAQGTLERVADRGEFRIGYLTDARPLSFEEDGRPAGYSVDICRRIAVAVREHLDLPDMRVSFVPVTLASRFDAIVDGDIDIECGSSTVTLGRQEQVDFTLMTFVTGGTLLSLADERVGTLSDLADKRVAVITDTTTEQALEAILSERLIDARVVGVTNSEEGMARLLDGRVDAYASDQIVLLGDALHAMDADEELSFSFADELFSYEPYALMVRRNDADFRLVANRAIAQLFRSGEYAVLYETWIGSNGIDPPALLIALYQLHSLSE
jgi:glutamate/aspartate transport system substrate-binding protein